MASRYRAPAGFSGDFRTDEDARAVYSEAAGIARIQPRAIAVPRNDSDVAVIVRWARDQGFAIVPRGSGSGMAGGAIGDGVVLDLSRLRGFIEPDAETRSMRVEVGVLRGELDRHARAVGLRFPVDPSSGEFCTVGGMAGTNAAGPHSLRHGSMRPWVLALECVFADGARGIVRRGEPPPQDIAAVHRFMQTTHAVLIEDDVVESHPNVLKDSSGYSIAAYAQTQDLIDLLVGSEGTLAIFTAVELALIPVAGATGSMLVSFNGLEQAVEAAVASRKLGAGACELLDRTFLKIAAKAGQALPVSPDAEAVLLVEIEAHDSATATADVERLRDIYRSLGAADSIVASGQRHESELWSFRHAASPAIARMDPGLRSMQFIEDAALPPDALVAYVRGVRDVLERCGTPGVIFGHAGDAHVHVNPLIDVSRRDWRDRVERILLDVTELVSKLNGTLTGEHGDGRLRTPLLDQVWTAEERRRFAMIKQAFDPSGIFNPGVKIPLPGQRAVDVVKYDPALDPLPPPARTALNTVERERAYARLRLDLL